MGSKHSWRIFTIMMAIGLVLAACGTGGTRPMAIMIVKMRQECLLPIRPPR